MYISIPFCLLLSLVTLLTSENDTFLFPGVETSRLLDLFSVAVFVLLSGVFGFRTGDPVRFVLLHAVGDSGGVLISIGGLLILLQSRTISNKLNVY